METRGEKISASTSPVKEKAGLKKMMKNMMTANPEKCVWPDSRIPNWRQVRARAYVDMSLRVVSYVFQGLARRFPEFLRRFVRGSREISSVPSLFGCFCLRLQLTTPLMTTPLLEKVFIIHLLHTLVNNNFPRI